MSAVGGEAAYRWEHVGDGGTCGAEGSVAERGPHERPGRFCTEPLFLDDRFELRLAFGGDERLPLLIDSAIYGDGVDERFDEVFLVAQCRAGIDGAGDLGTDLFIVPVAVLGAVL